MLSSTSILPLLKGKDFSLRKPPPQVRFLNLFNTLVEEEEVGVGNLMEGSSFPSTFSLGEKRLGRLRSWPCASHTGSSYSHPNTGTSIIGDGSMSSACAASLGISHQRPTTPWKAAQGAAPLHISMSHRESPFFNYFTFQIMTSIGKINLKKYPHSQGHLPT